MAAIRSALSLAAAFFASLTSAKADSGLDSSVAAAVVLSGLGQSSTSVASMLYLCVSGSSISAESSGSPSSHGSSRSMSASSSSGSFFFFFFFSGSPYPRTGRFLRFTTLVGSFSGNFALLRPAACFHSMLTVFPSLV